VSVDAGPERPEGSAPPTLSPRAKRWIVSAMALGIAAGLVMGFVPRVLQGRQLARSAEQQRAALPIVTVTPVQRAAADQRLTLPGTISPVEEAAIFARASGYVRERRVDIGDRVRRDLVLAIIDAPDLDRQVDQARAGVQQARSALGQAQAQYELAKVTRDRTRILVQQELVARQDGDTQEANYGVADANLRAAHDVVSANVANLNRLLHLQEYERVVAPFDGVVTERNIDVGALISASGAGMGTPPSAESAVPMTGSPGAAMFRVAQTERLRVFVNVPEVSVPSIAVGQPAELQVDALGQQRFAGEVTRTARAVDPATRTLLTEVQVPNPREALLPGMYARVTLSTVRAQPPLLVPADSVLTRSEGTMVPIVQDDTVHLRRVALGRDHGATVEIDGGLEDGVLVVINPGDSSVEGAKVQVRMAQAPPARR